MTEFDDNGYTAALYHRLALDVRLTVWSRVASIVGALIAGPGMVAIGWFAFATIQNGKDIARHEERLTQLSQRADQGDRRIDAIENRINRQFDHASAAIPALPAPVLP